MEFVTNDSKTGAQEIASNPEMGEETVRCAVKVEQAPGLGDRGGDWTPKGGPELQRHVNNKFLCLQRVC